MGNSTILHFTSETNILISGATGFVGTHLCEALSHAGVRIFGTLLPTESETSLVKGVVPVRIEEIGPDISLREVLKDIHVVIHLAARVHVMHESSADPLREFRKVNVLGSVNVARQAAAAGVKRFVFISTIGINGNDSGSTAYTETDSPHPHNPYSVSKYEAEQELRRVSTETGMEIVVIRAPLVYGPKNPGNFLSLLRVLSKGVPLPLASIRNEKSFIYVGNLVNALILCSMHPAAAGNTYLVSDAELISTPELIRQLARAVGYPARLFPFPTGLLRLIGKFIGKTAAVDSLLCSLKLDTSKIRAELQWTPPFTMEKGLVDTGSWYVKNCL